MIIQCDKCGAKFQLADDKVSGKGAKVRCSKCKAVFTVKKPKEQSDEASPPPRPEAAAPSGSAPEPPEPPGEDGGKDPFSDFNFSDDLDFGEKEEDITVEAKAKPQPPPEDFEPAPGSAAPPPDVGEEAPDQDFKLSGDADITFSEDQEPPPERPPAPPPSQDDLGRGDFSDAGPAQKKPAGTGPDDYGNFSFDEESFSEDSAPPQAPVARKPDEWGNVDVAGDAESGPEAGPGMDEDFEEAGYGDFKFDQDDSLPSSSPDEEDGMGADEFVRSPTSRSPVRDPHEASIDDSEPERPEADEDAALPPPKPVIKRDTVGGGSKKWILWVIVILMIPVVGLFGAVAYTNSQGWFTFSDLFTFEFDKIGPAYEQFQYQMGWKEPPDTGTVEIAGFKHLQLTRKDGTPVFAITGEVINKTRKAQYAIRVEAGLRLIKETGEEVLTGESYCDVSFTEEELKTMSAESIQDITTTSSGRDQGCLEVPPRETRAFTVVFFPDYTDLKQVKLSPPRVVDYKTLGE